MMSNREKISSSLEDYLEAIYEIDGEQDSVRAKDVAKRLNVAASSVTSALHGLARRNLVNHIPYDAITLTPRGQEIACEISRRHAILKQFFLKVLSVEEPLADECACKLEHVVPDNVLKRFVDFIKFEKCQHDGGIHWENGIGFVHNSRDRTAEKVLHSTGKS